MSPRAGACVTLSKAVFMVLLGMEIERCDAAFRVYGHNSTER